MSDVGEFYPFDIRIPGAMETIFETAEDVKAILGFFLLHTRKFVYSDLKFVRQ